MEAGLSLNTVSSAQLEVLPHEAPAEVFLHENPSTSASPLRRQMAERLAAHRQRRGRQGHASAQASLDIALPPARKKIAIAVAERYAQSPSYRAFLAQEAERAIEHAAAAAEIAARNAEAVVSAQQQLLAELELWTAPQEFKPESAVTLRPQLTSQPIGEAPPSVTGGTAPSAVSEASQEEFLPGLTSQPSASVLAAALIPPEPGTPTAQLPAVGVTVRLHDALSRKPLAPTELHCGPFAPSQGLDDLDEALALDEEIAFRQTPVFENYRDPKGPMNPIAANLVEFPRQLVASRKARPRIAEGPLRGETPGTPQLRIFEVEAEQISSLPAELAAAPEWSGIRLDAHSVVEASANLPDDAILGSLLSAHTVHQIAPLSLRLMAASVDGIFVLGAFVAFTAAAVSLTGQVPAGAQAAGIAPATVVLFYLLYQALFFTFSDQTPGMRLARIGFCTMTDENPSRSAMRRRIVAQLIAACPLGIGLLWVFLDDDRLGWHDRISRMYQRAY